MKKLYEAANLLEAQLLLDQLQQAGFDVVLQGEYLSGAVGELPVNTYPTLWLRDPQQEQAARALLATQLEVGVGPGWCCAQCGEWHDGQFSQCWRCGAERLG